MGSCPTCCSASKGAHIASPKDIAWIGGTVHHIAIDGEQTGGRLTVLRSAMRSPAASPVHVHRDDDETVMVLAGAMVIWRGAERFELSAGDTVFLPRGVPHSYRVIEDADVVTVCTPSGVEAFFARAGWDLAQGKPPAGWSVAPESLQAAASLTSEIVLGSPLDAGDEMPDGLRTWSPEGSRD